MTPDDARIVRAREIVKATLNPARHGKCNCRSEIDAGEWDGGHTMRAVLAVLRPADGLAADRGALFDALFDAIAIIGHCTNLSATALVSGKVLKAGEVWQHGYDLLFKRPTATALRSQPDPDPGYAPCPTCGQYSHSLTEDRITEALMHFTAMTDHRGDGIPTQHVFDQRTRDMAQVLVAAARAHAHLTPPTT